MTPHWSVFCSSWLRVDRPGGNSPAKRRLQGERGVRTCWPFGTDEKFFHHQAIRLPSEATRPPRPRCAPHQFRDSRRVLAALIQVDRAAQQLFSAEESRRERCYGGTQPLDCVSPRESADDRGDRP